MEGEETDWRNDIAVFHDKLKVADKESKDLKFLDEGISYKHPKYKPAIIFNVEVKGEKFTWFVSQNNFGVLGAIKEMGKPLTGQKAKLSRVGEGINDTEWTLVSQKKEQPQGA